MLHRYWFDWLFGRRVAANRFGGASAGFEARFAADAKVRASLRGLRSARNEPDLEELTFAELVPYRMVVTQSDECVVRKVSHCSIGSAGCGTSAAD
jgi:hypothetical protein